jgi:hypothetical protein
MNMALPPMSTVVRARLLRRGSHRHWRQAYACSLRLFNYTARRPSITLWYCFSYYQIRDVGRHEVGRRKGKAECFKTSCYCRRLSQAACQTSNAAKAAQASATNGEGCLATPRARTPSGGRDRQTSGLLRANGESLKLDGASRHKHS